MALGLTAVGCAAVALPLEGDEVGQVVVQAHARAGGVAPIVHFATSETILFYWIFKYSGARSREWFLIFVLVFAGQTSYEMSLK